MMNSNRNSLATQSPVKLQEFTGISCGHIAELKQTHQQCSLNCAAAGSLTFILQRKTLTRKEHALNLSQRACTNRVDLQ